jgi:8-oxo-dGTP pyrophosphatase MutT (NUDIX family)
VTERQVVGVLGWVRRGPAVLLVRRHDPALPAAHRKWELPGGKLRFGEAPAAAVAREVREETGYAVTVRSVFPYVYSTVWEYPDRRQHVVLLVYDCEAGRRRRATADVRVADVAWCAPDAIDTSQALPSVADFLTWWRLHQGDAAR